jgi:hypothetical protein
MGKWVALVIMIPLALASVGGWLWLSGEIDAGDERLAEGHRRLADGQDALAEGEVKLTAGRRTLSAGKRRYEQANDNRFLVFIDRLLNGGKGFREAREHIAKGSRQVAKGEDDVAVGEERLAAGERELSRGSERLLLARRVRLACALGAVCLVPLSIVFGFRWRRARVRTFADAGI